MSEDLSDKYMGSGVSRFADGKGINVTFACPICKGSFATIVQLMSNGSEKSLQDVEEKLKVTKTWTPRATQNVNSRRTAMTRRRKSIKASKMTLVHHQEKDSRSKKLVPRRTS
jgi:hypothetical protein